MWLNTELARNFIDTLGPLLKENVIDTKFPLLKENVIDTKLPLLKGNVIDVKLPLLKRKAPKKIIGNSSEESIHSGVINGILMEIDGIVEKYHKT